MLLKVKSLGFYAGRPIAILNKKTADKLDIHVDEKILIKHNNRHLASTADVAKAMLREDEIILSEEIMAQLNLKKGASVDIRAIPGPESVSYIREKIKGENLNYKKIYSIISDIAENRLSESEVAYFVSAVYIHKMDMEETEALTRAMIETGCKLNLGKGIIADKHGIGGVAGNRTTPIVVAICAAAGLRIPKTSSRAITSAGGTADVIEVLANVEFNISGIKKIIKKTNACLVWGGALGLAPADDKIVQVERLLRLDPEAQLIASILSKKISAGSTHVILDIPYGEGTKFKKEEAEELEKKFQMLGKKFNVKIKGILTKGDHPIGNGVGPVLEIIDVLSVLRQESNRPFDLEEKSILLASELLEMTGKAGKGKGREIAKKILQSGLAYKKFSEIIKAQGGNVNKKLSLARFTKDIFTEKNGCIMEMNNKAVMIVARTAGAPADKTAGLYLHKHLNETVKKGEKLITIYADNKEKLQEAFKIYQQLKPIVV